MRQKKSLLVIYKIVRLFFNALTADDKHYLLNRDNLTQTIQMQLYQKKQLFLNCFLHFQSLYSILNIFQERMTLIADVIPKLRAVKNVPR